MIETIKTILNTQEKIDRVNNFAAGYMTIRLKDKDLIVIYSEEGEKKQVWNEDKTQIIRTDYLDIEHTLNELSEQQIKGIMLIITQALPQEVINLIN